MLPARAQNAVASAGALLLPPLPAATSTFRDSPQLLATYRGPSPRSNWLVPGRILCGDQPATLDKMEGRQALVASGVTSVSAHHATASVQQVPRVCGPRVDRYRGKAC
jgi:hypothetical protein